MANDHELAPRNDLGDASYSLRSPSSFDQEIAQDVTQCDIQRYENLKW